MKKRLLAALLALSFAMSMAACSDAEDSETAAETETETEDSSDKTTTTAYDFDVLDYVTLGDYKGIEVTLEGEYEYSEEGYEAYVNSLISDAGLYTEDDSVSTVAEDSIVNVDYVGSQDGVAFEGGTASDVLLDVAANGEAISGTAYIDGFCDGLVGHSVGETDVACDVTFPESYGNTELAGADVVFTFNINYIARLKTAEELTEDELTDSFSCQTVEEFLATAKSDYEAQLAENLESDTQTAVANSIINAATVSGVPECLSDAMLNLNIQVMEQTYCSDGQTLEEYLENYGTDYDSFIASLKENIAESLESELIFQAIAETEGLTLDEDEFADYMDSMVSSSGVSSADVIYDYYTLDGLDGEEYLRQEYLLNQAVEFCTENATVSY